MRSEEKSLHGLKTISLIEHKRLLIIETYSSVIESTYAGVPQGSVLRPLLRLSSFFLIYINNVVENISNQIRLFTDDTSLFVVVDENDNDAAK